MAIVFGNLDRELADRQNVIKEDAARQYRGSRDTMKSITDLGQTVSTEIKNYKANEREEERIKYNIGRNEESDKIRHEQHGMNMLKGELDAWNVKKKNDVAAWNLKKWKGGSFKNASDLHTKRIAEWRDDISRVDAYDKMGAYPGLYSTEALEALRIVNEDINSGDLDDKQKKAARASLSSYKPVSMMEWAVNNKFYDESDYGDPHAESDAMMTRVFNKYSSITGMHVPDANSMISSSNNNQLTPYSVRFGSENNVVTDDLGGTNKGDLHQEAIKKILKPVVEVDEPEVEPEPVVKNNNWFKSDLIIRNKGDKDNAVKVQDIVLKTGDGDAVVTPDADASTIVKPDVVDSDSDADDSVVSRSGDWSWKDLFLSRRNLSGTKSTIYKGGSDDNATTINDQLATAAGSAVKNKLATDKQQKQAFIKANTPTTDSYKPKELVLNPAAFEMTQSQILQNLRTLEDNGLSRGLPIDDSKRVIVAGSVDANLLVGRGDARSGNADNIIEMLGITDPGKKKEWKSYLMSDSVNSDYGHGKKGKLTTNQEYKRLQLRLTSEQTDTLMGWAYNKSMREVNNNFGFSENTYKEDQGGVPYLKHIIGDMGYRHGSSFMKKGDSGNYPKFGRAVKDLTEATTQADQLVAYNKMNHELFSTGIYSDFEEGPKGDYKKHGGTNRFKFLRDRMDRLKIWITRGEYAGGISLYDPEGVREQERLTELENNMQKSFILNQEAKNRLDKAAINKQIRLQDYENSTEGIINEIENPEYMMNKQYQGLRLAD